MTGCTKDEYLALSRVEREERRARAEGSTHRALSGEDAKKLLASRAGV